MAPFLSKFQKTGLALTTLSLLQNSPQKREFWSKKWLRKRKKFTHSVLLKELDSNNFRHFLRMNEQCFCKLLSMIKPLIEKQNTVLRESVNAEERLIVTQIFGHRTKVYWHEVQRSHITPTVIKYHTWNLQSYMSVSVAVREGNKILLFFFVNLQKTVTSLVSAFSVRILSITGVPQTPVIFITL